MSAYVQSNSTTGFGSTTCVYSSAQTATNTNAVSITCTAVGATIADTSVNTYTQTVTDLHGANNYYFSVFYCLSIAAAGAGSNTVTVTGGGTPLNIDVLEYSGIGATLDGSSVTTTGGNSTGALSKTTTNANDVLVAFIGTEANATGFTTSGVFTQRHASTGGYNGATADYIIGSTGTYTATWNWTNFDNFYIAIVPFKSGAVVPPSVAMNPKFFP